jgi:hypothetical protein
MPAVRSASLPSHCAPGDPKAISSAFGSCEAGLSNALPTVATLPTSAITGRRVADLAGGRAARRALRVARRRRKMPVAGVKAGLDHSAQGPRPLAVWQRDRCCIVLLSGRWQVRPDAVPNQQCGRSDQPGCGCCRYPEGAGCAAMACVSRRGESATRGRLCILWRALTPQGAAS